MLEVGLLQVRDEVVKEKLLCSVTLDHHTDSFRGVSGRSQRRAPKFDLGFLSDSVAAR
jgi:hypothetical protein